MLIIPLDHTSLYVIGFEIIGTAGRCNKYILQRVANIGSRCEPILHRLGAGKYKCLTDSFLVLQKVEPY